MQRDQPAEMFEGPVCGIYVIYPGEEEMSGVEVFVQDEGGWRRLFNTTDVIADWRADVEKVREMIEETK